MIVVDIAPRYYPVHHRTVIDGLLSIPIETIKTRNEAETILADYVQEMGLRQFLLKNMVRTESGYDWKVNLSVIDDEIEHIGEGLSGMAFCDVPTLFLSGGESDYVTQKDHVNILHHFPNAVFEVLENAGHWLHVDKPQETIQKIENFLAK